MVMSEHRSVSIVVPVYNEAENLGELIERCLHAARETPGRAELILVDDGSMDGSREIISRAAETHDGAVVGVFFNRNYGQHAAVMAGLAESDGDIVVTLDADLQNPPEEIPRLVRKMIEGYDVVGSVRVPRRDPFFRRLSSHVINKVVRNTTGVMMHDYGCMLRAYSRNVVDAMLSCRERSMFIPILANSYARRTTEIEVRHENRVKGRSKYDLWKLVNLQFDLLTSMTTSPLRFLSFLGLVISLVGFGFGAYLFVGRIIYGRDWAVGGVFTLFAILFIFIGAQFVGLGLLGEYIGRVYHDVRARPRYFVEQVVGRRAGPAPGDRTGVQQLDQSDARR